MRQQFLDGGMCEGHVCSNTQQGIMSGFVVFFHALYCEQIPLAKNCQHCYKALNFYSLIAYFLLVLMKSLR